MSRDVPGKPPLTARELGLYRDEDSSADAAHYDPSLVNDDEGEDDTS